MKLKLSLILTSLLFLLPLKAQTFNTGDKQLDRWLININFVAQKDPEQYLAGLAKKYKIDHGRLILMHSEFEFSPADMSTLIGLAKATNQNVDKLRKIFNQNRNKGYKYVFNAAGATKKSKQFASFKTFIKNQAPKRDLEADSRNIFITKKPK